MSGNGHLDARQLRSRLKHPVIDAGGHRIEFETPYFFSALETFPR